MGKCIESDGKLTERILVRKARVGADGVDSYTPRG